MIIVSDTSILSGLLLVNLMDLLGDVYDEVIIPKVVLDELLVLKDFGYELAVYGYTRHRSDRNSDCR